MLPFITIPSVAIAVLFCAVSAGRAAQFTVTSPADSGAGTLRAAVAAALAQGGTDEIVFGAALSGQTITLTGGEIAIGAQTLKVYGKAPTGGVTLNGSNGSRIFSVPAGGSLELYVLTLGRGNAGGGGGGGAVSNAGTLTATGCTFRECTGGGGGAVRNAGTFTATHCTFARNAAASGGAIYGVTGTAALIHCTLSDNMASSGSAISNDAALTLTNCIVAGNNQPQIADILNTGTVTRTGINIVGSLQNNGAGGSGGPVAIAAAPRLQPLGNYGGPTPTMPPQADSPALDRITSTSFTTDQRGFPRMMWGAADIGAVEAGTQADCAWEVREFYRTPATALNSLADALALAADPAAVVLVTTPAVVNRSDPDNAGGGYFPGDEPVACDNKTPQGLLNGDDNDFATVARTFISITAEDDYTFGFSSSEGAQLRIFGAAFTSSTRLNAANPANPAHNGDTLSFPGLTDNAATLGVCHLTPGVYPVEFVSWERTGAAFAEVFAARGAKTAVDGSFRLAGDAAAGGAMTAGSLTAQPLPQPWTQEFEDGTGGFTVTNPNGPIEGPWTRDAVNGTWATAGQSNAAFSAPTTLLTGPSITMQCSGDAMLSFSHRFSFEDGNWDGGQVRLSVNGGPFNLVPGTAFSQGGYTGTAAPTSIAEIRGQEAFVLDSAGYALPVYNTSTALLGTFNAGDTLRVQFMASFDQDNGRGVPAWEIDSVSIEQQCAGGTPGWEVTSIHNGAGNLTSALNQLFAQWSGTPQANTLTTLATVLNFEGPGTGGGHGQTGRFPGDTAGDDDQFAVGARATLNVPAAGDYTFCLLADDSARLRIPGSRWWTVSGGGATLVDGFSGGGGGDVFGQVNLRAGAHPLEVAYEENTGNALLSLWAARGRHTVFSPDIFSLVGGTGVQRANAPFTLTRQTGLTRPVNDDFAAATRLVSAGPARVTACTTGASAESGEPALPGEGATVWWQWQAAAAGTYVLDTAGSDFDTVLAVYSGTALGSLTSTAASDNDDFSSLARVTLTVAAAGTYMIQAGGAGGATGRVVLQVQAVTAPSNNDFGAALPLGSPYAVSITGSNDAATAEGSEPNHVTGLPARSSLWYTWTAPVSGSYQIHSLGSRIDTVLAVYTGGTLTGLTKVASNDDASAGTGQSAVTVRAAAGALYRIAVDGRDAGARGEVRLSITHLAAVTGTELLSGPLPASPRTFRLTWNAEPWATYQVESSPDLATWSTAVGGLPSAGLSTTLDIGGLPAATGHRYFRVRRE